MAATTEAGDAIPGFFAVIVPDVAGRGPPAQGAGMRPDHRRLETAARGRSKPCFGVIGDPGEQAAHLDGGRHLALLLIGATDCGGIGFGDDEHGGQHGDARDGGQANSPTEPR
jgi:hypothetical protein